MNYDLSARLMRTNPGIDRPRVFFSELIYRERLSGVLWRRLGSLETLFPDLDDDATRGALLGRLRELTGRHHLCMHFEPMNGWAIVDDANGERLTGWHESEQEAIVAGFEEVPRV